MVVKNISKKYREVSAVEDVSFTVESGKIVGLLGPNGAGKTTIINIILGLVLPDRGRILIKGEDLRLRSKVLKDVGFFASYAPLPGNLTVYENLYIFSLLYGFKDKSRIEEIIDKFNLRKFTHTKSGLLSSGEQTRLGLAKSFLNNPKLLLLDEPTSSLDPSVAKETRLIIKNFVKENNCGVLWTSHNMHEVEEVCDRVIFLSKGKIFLEGDPRVLPSLYNKANLEELFISLAKEPLSLGGL